MIPAIPHMGFYLLLNGLSAIDFNAYDLIRRNVSLYSNRGYRGTVQKLMCEVKRQNIQSLRCKQAGDSTKVLMSHRGIKDSEPDIT